MGCYNAAILDAPADRIWATLSDFHDGSWAPNVVESLEPIGDTDSRTVGAGRLLNGVFRETLRTMDDEAMSFTYSIDDGPGPMAATNVSGYVGEVRVLPVTVGNDGEQTVVVWISRWASENGEGGSVAEFCDPIYRALLTDMKAHFG